MNTAQSSPTAHFSSSFSDTRRQPCDRGQLPSQLKAGYLPLVRHLQRRDVVVHRDCVGLQAMAFDSCCLCKLSPRRITTSTRMYWSLIRRVRGSMTMWRGPDPESSSALVPVDPGREAAAAGRAEPAGGCLADVSGRHASKGRLDHIPPLFRTIGNHCYEWSSR